MSYLNKIFHSPKTKQQQQKQSLSSKIFGLAMDPQETNQG